MCGQVHGNPRQNRQKVNPAVDRGRSPSQTDADPPTTIVADFVPSGSIICGSLMPDNLLYYCCEMLGIFI